MPQAFTDFSGISASTWSSLFDAAIKHRQNAYAPYSNFQVGAAILTSDDEIFAGCNVENATFGATVCAERHAIATAVGEGHRKFRALCVLTDVDSPVAPCGICRQVIAEFCDELPILLVNLSGKHQFLTLSELLPHRFSGSDF